MRCDQCRCGWVMLAGQDWASPCEYCLGKCRLSYYRIGKLLDEHPSPLKRVNAMRSTTWVAARVLGSIYALQAATPSHDQRTTAVDRNTAAVA